MADTLSTLTEYTAANVLPDISPILRVALVKSPLLNWIRLGQPHRGDSAGLFYWPELVREETTGTLAANYVAAGTITVAAGHGTRFKINDIIYIEKHRDVNHLLVKFRVTNIVGDVLTVSVVHGADTNFALAAPAQIIHRQFPAKDNAAAGTEKTDQHTLISNYLQMFQRDLTFGYKAERLAAAGGVPGLASLRSHGFEQKMHDIIREIANAVWYGDANAETASIGSSMAGLDAFINTSSAANRVDAGAGPLVEDDIGDLVEKLRALGLPNTKPLRLFVHPTNARVISNLRLDKIRLVQTDTSIGQQVQQYIPDLPDMQPMTITVDDQIPNDQVFLISTDDVELVPAIQPSQIMDRLAPPPIIPGLQGQNVRGLSWMVPSTTPGQHGENWTIRAEMGLKVAYATRYHGVIYNIAP